MNMRPVFIHNNRYIYAVRQGETLTGCPYTLAGPYISGQTSLQNIFHAYRNYSAKADGVEVPSHHHLLIRFMLACNACRILYQDDNTPLDQLLESPIPNLEKEPQLSSDISELIALFGLPNIPTAMTAQEQRGLFRALVKSINQVQHGNLVCFQAGPGVYATGWTELAIQANGCVFEQDTGRLVSLPFDKAFNLSEAEQADQSNVLKNWNAAYRVDCMEKLDGCLIMVSRYQDGLLVTTPGSFDNEQIQAAKALMPFSTIDLADGFTYLFELISPKSKKVVDYGQKEALILVGVRSNATGGFASGLSLVGDKLSTPVAKVASMPLQTPEKTLPDLINKMNGCGDNAEGYVLRFWDKDGNVSLVQLKYHKYFQKFRQGRAELEEQVFQDMFFGGMSKLLNEVDTKAQIEQMAMVETINSILGAFLERVNQTARALLETVGDGHKSFSEMLESPVSNAYINVLIERQPKVMWPYLLSSMEDGGHLSRKIFSSGEFTWEDWCKVRDFMEEK